MKTHDVKQGSGEWLALRAGIPTASELDALISPEWKVRTGESPQTYLYRKLTEKVLGFPLDSGFQSSAMETGTLMELEAIPYLGFTYGIEVQRVGFCTTDDGRCGCSPDGLIGTDGGLEVKCPNPETHLKYLLEGELPKHYRAQVHGCMYVTGRKWWTFMSYSRQFPPLIMRIERDEAIQAKIHEAFTAFLARFDEAKAKIDAMRAEEFAAAESKTNNDKGANGLR
jgi:hypothetical protein